MEFSPFIDVMGWARNDFGFDIHVDICGFTKTVNSTFGVTINSDILIDNVKVEDYDALVVPGGFEEYDFYKEAYDEKTLELIRTFDQFHKFIASVCVGALPIAKSGVLNNRKATTYHFKDGYRRDELASLGAILGDKWLVVDDNIITSSCPKTAVDVAFQLLEMLISKDKAAQVKEAMGYS